MHLVKVYYIPTVPVVTISPLFMEVNEGRNFTLTCTSSIPGLPFNWDYLNSSSHSANVEFSQPLQENITVFSPTGSNERSYTCQIRELGEVIAFATATVNVVILREHALITQIHFVYLLIWSYE